MLWCFASVFCNPLELCSLELRQRYRAYERQGDFGCALMLLCSAIQRLRPAVKVLQQGDFSRVFFCCCVLQSGDVNSLVMGFSNLGGCIFSFKLLPS